MVRLTVMQWIIVVVELVAVVILIVLIRRSLASRDPHYRCLHERHDFQRLFGEDDRE
jgi:hypothetical protein